MLARADIGDRDPAIEERRAARVAVEVKRSLLPENIFASIDKPRIFSKHPAAAAFRLRIEDRRICGELDERRVLRPP